jgi:GxxExxY protein
MILHEALSEAIIGAAIEVHKQTGLGLLENAYQKFMEHELTLRRIAFRPQVPLPVRYKGVELDCGYRMDLVVEQKIVVELKAVEMILAVHEAQLITYLKLSGIRVGLLINFCVPTLKDGIIRRVL